MMQAEIRSSGGGPARLAQGDGLWTLTFLGIVFLVHQAGMLVYAIALLASIHGLPRPGRE
jgi:hypothetical protein